MLQIVDAQWKDHLYSLDHLKEGIGLRGYGQRDPLVEYKKESFALFQAMKGRIDEEMVRYLWRLRPVISEGGDAPAPVRPAPRRPAPPLTLSAGPVSSCDASRRRTTAARANRRRRCAGVHGAASTNRKSAATIRATAAAERNTRSVTVRESMTVRGTKSPRLKQ
jgi:preprotein translocase subunit SecA